MLPIECRAVAFIRISCIVSWFSTYNIIIHGQYVSFHPFAFVCPLTPSCAAHGVALRWMERLTRVDLQRSQRPPHAYSC